MGLDICRFIEIKRNNKWERIKWGKEVKTQSIDDASHFNNGKNILEWWLSSTNLCIDGIPNDSDSIEVYKEWGYHSKWVTLNKIESILDDYEHILHKDLKSCLNQTKLDEILQILKKEPKNEQKEFYPCYPWNDYDIKDEFDDTYACGILKLSCLRDDLYTVKGIIESLFDDGYLISSEDIRIVFVYNN